MRVLFFAAVFAVLSYEALANYESDLFLQEVQEVIDFLNLIPVFASEGAVPAIYSEANFLSYEFYLLRKATYGKLKHFGNSGKAVAAELDVQFKGVFDVLRASGSSVVLKGVFDSTFVTSINNFLSEVQPLVDAYVALLEANPNAYECWAIDTHYNAFMGLVGTFTENTSGHYNEMLTKMFSYLENIPMNVQSDKMKYSAAIKKCNSWACSAKYFTDELPDITTKFTAYKERFVKAIYNNLITLGKLVASDTQAAKTAFGDFKTNFEACTAPYAV